MPGRWSAAPVLLSAALAACGGSDTGTGPTTSLPSRTYLMGFGGIPPRPDAALVLRTIDLWALRADAGLIFLEPPWSALLAGEDPETLVRNDPLGIANYYRAEGLRIVANIDPTDGLNRAQDSPALVAAGRSLTEPAVRKLYARYVAAFAALVRPDYSFTDLDLAAFPLPPDTTLRFFASLRLVDIDLAPKPALAAWDATFRRPLRL